MKLQFSKQKRGSQLCAYAVPAGKYSIYIAFCELRTYNLKCNV